MFWIVFGWRFPKHTLTKKSLMVLHEARLLSPVFFTILISNPYLGGGFKYFLFSTLFGEDSHFD